MNVFVFLRRKIEGEKGEECVCVCVCVCAWSRKEPARCIVWLGWLRGEVAIQRAWMLGWLQDILKREKSNVEPEPAVQFEVGCTTSSSLLLCNPSVNSTLTRNILVLCMFVWGYEQGPSFMFLLQWHQTESAEAATQAPGARHDHTNGPLELGEILG